MKPRTILPFLFTFFITFHVSCRTNTVKTDQENRMMQNYTADVELLYSRYLVPQGRYSIKAGIDLQERHKKILVTFAREMTEVMKLKLATGSLGFYFDRRSDHSNEFYLGFDVNTGGNYVDSYTNTAVEIVRNQLRRMLEAVSLCASVLQERNVIGVVVGWRWEQSGEQKKLNVWVAKKDVIAHLEGQLTFEELVQRSTVTNSSNTIIRLPL